MGLLEAYKFMGGNPSITKAKDVAYLFVSENKILSANAVEGMVLEKESIKEGVDVKLRIKEGCKIGKPIHLCFGVIPKEGIQRINTEIIAEKNSKACLLAHCVFPNAVKVKHLMDARFMIEEGASLRYEEIHWHGNYGGATVIPRARIINYGEINTTFSLLIGRVGKLDIDYSIDAKRESISEMITKVYGKGNDEIKVKEGIVLNGEYARSVIKSRIAVKDNASSEVTNISEGNAPYARGHVDCTEIVQDNAIAKAIPIVNVSNEKAKVTHEAAIGSVDKKQLETLMARGLEEEKAIDTIIKGMLG
ncbi:MAG: SufD family Fe-S cluster assembly protein [Candidatus Thermoplasmatota archaeon]|nr:SufD family Fe-S cluster assembly protein [Candidatus Thermoplasmatota archaeon]